MNIRCVVSCRNACGEPDFYHCTIECSQEEYDEGLHYDEARSEAEEAGYEATDRAVVYDENDGPHFLFKSLFKEGEEESAGVAASAGEDEPDTYQKLRAVAEEAGAFVNHELDARLEELAEQIDAAVPEEDEEEE